MPNTGVELPIPPVAINVDSSGYGDSIPKAWRAQHAAAVSDYAARDDGSGDIANVGSPGTSVAADTTTPAPYIQTFDQAGDFV